MEADDQQVNLTRFSLFFPEKRRFFLERASIFDFSFGGFNRLFYTRRIGLQNGEPVRIMGGGRLSGRIGNWEVGILNVQTAATNRLPAENFGVLRVRKRVFNPYSYIGGMNTSRIDAEGNYHLGYGLDGIFRLFGDDYLTVNLAQTYENSAGMDFNFIDASRVRLFYERRSYNDFAYRFSVERAGKDYNPAVGFDLREDFSSYSSTLSYGWNLKDSQVLQRHQFSLSADVFRRNEDGILETIEVSPHWIGAFAFGGDFTLGLLASRENLLNGFELSDGVEVAAGEYLYQNFYGNFSTPGGRELSSSFNASYGAFFDGRRFSAGFSPKWIVSKYLELSGSYQFDYIDFPNRNQSLKSHLARLRGLVALNTKLSLAAFIQYSSAAKLSLANVRFRYNSVEGNDLYLVYNEQFNADRRREIPALPVSRNRAILAKYTYTFTF